MVRRPKIKEDAQVIKAKILCYLHYLHAHERDSAPVFESISEALPMAPHGIISYALEELINDHLISDRGEYGYFLRSDGVNEVENWSDKTYEDTAKGIIFPEIDGNTFFSYSIPASDRIVTLDHNSEDYKETVAALEQVSKEARESNEFGHLFTDSDDRIRISSEIDAGLGLLKKNIRVNAEHIKNLLIPNLKLIKEKLQDAALSTLVSKALEWLAKLLGA